MGVEPGGTYSEQWSSIIFIDTLKDKSFPIFCLFVLSND